MFPDNKSEHGSETSNGLRTCPATTLGEDDHFTNSRMLNSPSSSCSSSSGDRFELDTDEISKSYTGDVGVPEYSKNTRYDHDGGIPISSMPWQEQQPNHAPTLSSDNGSTAQFPPTQVMERPAESNSSASYRIPSSVFARTQSNAQMEWSVTSNGSLFSIYTGNMSFITDDQNSVGKSGEIGFPGDSTLPNPLIDLSSNQHPINKSTDVGPKNANVDEYLGVTESKAPETMRGVVKEDGGDDNKERSLAKGSLHSARLSHRSDASGESIQSFAFPILTGDDKSYSLSQKHYPSSRHRSQPPTPRSAQSPRARLESQPLSEPVTVPKANTSEVRGRWFSCIPCCSFCS
ncbi:uncharacterized protein [Populus alba]|uniref:Uncharacterized protein n=2 Tax=Populus TaxID=3689 RepID=A0A4U5QYA5_POPAL|nr:hypothetical protein NC653_034741 [Populus alba x Populus x berolinensis]TKS16158.1 hypothetical protein D5086_0000027310 [Populus alba]